MFEIFNEKMKKKIPKNELRNKVSHQLHMGARKIAF